RCCLVAGYKALTEISQEVVGACLWPRCDEMAARLGKTMLHLEPRELFENLRHFDGWDHCFETEAAIVKSDAHGAESHFRLFVKRDRCRRIEGDAIPYQLSTTLIETEIHRKAPCEVCALHFEATRAGEVFVERDVMQQGSYSDDFRVVINVLQLPNPHCKEPGADNVVEKVRLALPSGILHCPVARSRPGDPCPA